jgi:hypothetical protein
MPEFCLESHFPDNAASVGHEKKAVADAHPMISARWPSQVHGPPVRNCVTAAPVFLRKTIPLRPMRYSTHLIAVTVTVTIRVTVAVTVAIAIPIAILRQLYAVIVCMLRKRGWAAE